MTKRNLTDPPYKVAGEPLQVYVDDELVTVPDSVWLADGVRSLMVRFHKIRGISVLEMHRFRANFDRINSLNLLLAKIGAAIVHVRGERQYRLVWIGDKPEWAI